MFELRPYQRKFIDTIRKQFCAGNRRVCGVMPCGAGKTLATADMARRTAAKGNRVVFMVHRQELIEQTSATFSALGIEHGIIASGVEPNYELPVQVASVQTLVNRLDQVPRPKLLIVDECHHIEADTYRQIVDEWDSYLLGLTATPIRMGGRTLHDSFDALVEGVTVSELIDGKYLTNYEYFASMASLDGLNIRAGEYTNASMSRVMDRMEVIGDVVQSYIDYANGRKAICYCVNVEHSKHITAQFNDSGVKARHIDSKTPTSERREIIEQFREGEITVLCNVELFGEGFDVPSMDCVILARPTRSLTLFIQQAMRALRPDPNNPSKKAIVLDHVRNFERFGELTVDRRWSLDENPETLYVGEAPEGKPGNRLNCRDGFMQKVFDSSVQIDELIKYFLKLAKDHAYKIAWAAFKALPYARSERDCKVIGRACGYKDGWGWHQWKKQKRLREERATVLYR